MKKWPRVEASIFEQAVKVTLEIGKCCFPKKNYGKSGVTHNPDTPPLDFVNKLEDSFNQQQYSGNIDISTMHR
jgi:hypothetical protein